MKSVVTEFVSSASLASPLTSDFHLKPSDERNIDWIKVTNQENKTSRFVTETNDKINQMEDSHQLEEPVRKSLFTNIPPYLNYLPNGKVLGLLFINVYLLHGLSSESLGGWALPGAHGHHGGPEGVSVAGAGGAHPHGGHGGEEQAQQGEVLQGVWTVL